MCALLVQRKIIHIDMDAFFAAIEERDQPKYANKPVIVGGMPDTRGVVATCNYVAREYGIHSGMSSARAYRKCPFAVFLKPRFEVYKSVSQQIYEIFIKHTPFVEMASLDEAYLDVTTNTAFKGSAILLAKAIQQEIFEKTKLTASVGISYNKFLAKMASDLKKPKGVSVILPEEGVAFIHRLPIGKFHGIGKSTERKMQSLGIYTGADLATFSKQQLQTYFHRRGEWFYDLAKGIDHREVEVERIRKSYGHEITYQEDLKDEQRIYQEVERLTHEVCNALVKAEVEAKTLTLKVKYADFEQVTRSVTLPYGFQRFSDVVAFLPILLNKVDLEKQNIRLLGITAANFVAIDGFIQLPLFPNGH